MVGGGAHLCWGGAGARDTSLRLTLPKSPSVNSTTHRPRPPVAPSPEKKLQMRPWRPFSGPVSTMTLSPSLSVEGCGVRAAGCGLGITPLIDTPAALDVAEVPPRPSFKNITILRIVHIVQYSLKFEES